jgi:hypothetical protein
MRPTHYLLKNGVADVGGIVAKEEGAMAHPVVNVAATIRVPLMSPIGAVYKDGKGLHAPVVVGDPIGEEVLGPLEERSGGWQGLPVGVLELPGVYRLRHGCSFASPSVRGVA